MRAWRPQARDNSSDAPREESSIMVTDRVIFVCTLIVAAVYLYATTLIPSIEIGDPLGPKAFPRLLGIFLLIAAGLLFLEIWKDRKRAAQAAEPVADWGHVRLILVVTAWTAAYYFAFDRLGYVVASAVYLLALTAYFHKGKWVSNVLTTLLFSGLSYWMFVALDVNLPKGILPF
jgi:putative tricarboxylic transport membrane protein